MVCVCLALWVLYVGDRYSYQPQKDPSRCHLRCHAKMQNLMSQCLNHHHPWDVSDIGAVEACAFFFLLGMTTYPCLWFGGFIVSRALNQIYAVHGRGGMTGWFCLLKSKGGRRLRLTPSANGGMPEEPRINVHLCND